MKKITFIFALCTLMLFANGSIAGTVRVATTDALGAISTRSSPSPSAI